MLEFKAGPRDDPRWQMVERIAASPQFRRAAQLQGFLLYLARNALNGNPGDISEQDIAINVLGRPADFRPNEDNIVRVQARQLRRKLDEYFAREGKDEPLIVTVPKGCYAAQFGPRPKPEIDPAEPPAIASPWRWRAAAAMALLAMMAVVGVALWRRARPAAVGGTTPNPLWARMFAKGQKTNIVLGDTSAVYLQAMQHSRITLDHYLDRRYPNNVIAESEPERVQHILRRFSLFPHTGFGEANMAAGILNVSSRYAGQTVLRHARHLNIREMKSDNFIMLGASMAIPWNELFEPRLGFAVEYDMETYRHLIRDKFPEGGREQYQRPVNQEGPNQTYALLALTPNLGGHGTVLLVIGLSMESMEAAGEFLMSEDFSRRIRAPGACQSLNLSSDFFEVLLRTRTVSDGASGVEMLKCRPLPQPSR